MHWLPRLAGLGVVLGLLGWSFHFSLQQLDGPPSIDGSDESTAVVERATDDEVVATSEDGSAPEYLSFVGAVPSGRYSVADLPDSRDWDYGERGGREPEQSHISPDNPVAEQLTVVDNDYVTAPGSEDSDSEDSESEDDDRRPGSDDRGPKTMRPVTASLVTPCRRSFRECTQPSSALPTVNTSSGGSWTTTVTTSSATTGSRAAG